MEYIRLLTLNNPDNMERRAILLPKLPFNRTNPIIPETKNIRVLIKRLLLLLLLKYNIKIIIIINKIPMYSFNP